MNETEVILNLWYVCDKNGVISSLRARTYVGSGTSSEMMAYLRQFAATDYQIAREFPIPDDFRIQGKPVTHKAALDYPGAAMALFAEAFFTLQNELPNGTPCEIPDQPLVCLTPLLRDEAGDLNPILEEQKRL